MIPKLGGLSQHPGQVRALSPAVSEAGSESVFDGDLIQVSGEDRNFLTVSPGSKRPAINRAVKAGATTFARYPLALLGGVAGFLAGGLPTVGVALSQVGSSLMGSGSVKGKVVDSLIATATVAGIAAASSTLGAVPTLVGLGIAGVAHVSTNAWRAYKAGPPTFDIGYDKARFQSTFVEQAAGKIAKKGGEFSPAASPEARAQQFLQAYRAAESLSPGLGAQVALKTMRGLLTPEDLVNYDRDVRGDLGGQIVSTETFQGFPLHTVEGGDKPGTSSPLAGYVADRGLSQLEADFIKGHEISHVRHKDSIQFTAFRAVDESLVEQNATLEERAKLFELGQDSNHQIELRCDRESIESLLEAGHDPSKVRDLADSKLFKKAPDGAYTHPPDALRRQQIEDMTGGQG